MHQDEPHVSTEPQRLALEAMSAQLVHKLNAMIREQEERVRIFAEQHHATTVLPQQFTPAAPPPQPEPAPGMMPKPQVQQAPPPATRSVFQSAPAPVSAPVRSLSPGPRQKTAPPEEESNIGAGMIIFALVGIIILLRSCT